MGSISSVDIAALFIAIVAALGTWAGARASAKASMKNSDTSARVEMEKEAYERARKLDIATITRQDEEMEELRSENQTLKNDNESLHSEIKELKNRIDRLERTIEALRHEGGAHG